MLYLATIQSILSALLFLLKKPNHLSNKLLSLWFIINTLNFVGSLLPQGLVSYIKIGYVPFLYLIGPLFYFYVQSQIHIEFKLKWKHLLHLIPFALMSASRLLYFKGSFAPSFYYEGKLQLNYFLVYATITLSILGYLGVIFVLWSRHRKNVKNYFSNTSQKIMLDWVAIMVSTASISYLLLLFAPLFLKTNNSVFWFNQFNLAMLGFFMLIFGLLQPVLYHEDPVNIVERKTDNSNKKYEHSGISNKQLTTYAEMIICYTENNKPYLQSEYNLEMMARDLNITRQNISQTLNEKIGKNFYQLINEYRVSEFKSLLKNPKYSHITFLGLAFEAGFNSKSSFYRVFKEITGETPTEYRKRQNKTLKN